MNLLYHLLAQLRTALHPHHCCSSVSELRSSQSCHASEWLDRTWAHRAVASRSPPAQQTRSPLLQQAESVSFLMKTWTFGWKLFCSACREEVALKCSIITNHISSAKHKQSKIKLATKDGSETDIAEALVVYDKQEHPRGEILPTDRRVYWVKVVRAFLKAGIPLAKLDHFCDFLKENAYWLSDRRGTSDLIPFISSEEVQCIAQ